MAQQELPGCAVRVLVALSRRPSLAQDTLRCCGGESQDRQRSLSVPCRTFEGCQVLTIHASVSAVRGLMNGRGRPSTRERMCHGKCEFAQFAVAEMRIELRDPQKQNNDGDGQCVQVV